jgi:heptaprenylglyceryl phosphate synthase
MISRVRETVQVPIMVGGGIRDTAQAHAAWENGATAIVVGNSLMDDPNQLLAYTELKRTFKP